MKGPTTSMTLTADAASLWLRRFHPAQEMNNRLICFPHAGGSASFYFPVSKALSVRTDVVAIQYPGRQDRRNEPCIETIAELADQVSWFIRPLADRPLTFFGHSMGAILSFEVARRLEATGIVLSGFFASGRRAPSAYRDERVHLRDDNGLLADVRALSGTDSQLLSDEEIVSMVLPAIRSDYKAAETYRYQPGPELRCPIFALVGDKDPKATVDEARVWGMHTTGPFLCRVFRGGHFYLNSHAPTIIDIIAEHLGSIPSSAQRTRSAQNAGQ